MNENEKEKFAELLMTIGEIFDKKLSENIIKIYWGVLNQYSFNDFGQAVNNIVRTKTFNKFPLPAEFIEFINPQIDLYARAIEAANEVVKKVDKDGAYASVEFNDPVIHQTIEVFGGWIDICNEVSRLDYKDLRFWKKDFERVYKAMAQKGYTAKTKLVGMHEAGNKEKGYLDNNGNLKLADGTIVKQLPDGTIEDLPKLPGSDEVKQIETTKPE